MLSGADWLVIGGGALEAVGGLTIAFDIRKTSKEFRRYEKRPRSIYAHATTMELAALVGAVGVVVSGGREPAVEERLDSLEERINSFQHALDDTSRKLKADLKEWTRRELNDAGMGTSFQLVDPTWSPSGTYLATLANLQDSEFAYVPVVFTPDGRFVAFGQASGDYPEPFEWSPVADVLAYTRREEASRVTEAYLLDPVSGDDRVLVSGEGTQSFFALTNMAWAPSGRWLAIAGWVDLGEGGFRTSFRVLDPADPASFEQFSVETAEADNFLAAWRP